MTNKIYNATVALLINDENKILLQLRDNKKGIVYPNMWGALGGRMEKDETPLIGMLRELLEEIGYKPKNLKFLDMIPYYYGKLFIFLGKINLPIEQITLTEGQKLDYFGLEQLKDINIVPVLRDYIYLNKNKIFI